MGSITTNLLDLCHKSTNQNKQNHRMNTIYFKNVFTPIKYKIKDNNKKNYSDMSIQFFFYKSRVLIKKTEIFYCFFVHAKNYTTNNKLYLH